VFLVGLVKHRTKAVLNAKLVAQESLALGVNIVRLVMPEKVTTMIRLNANNVNWVKQQRWKVRPLAMAAI
jgi:hypothetical protein